MKNNFDVWYRKLRRFVKRNDRFPRRCASLNSERKLAVWVSHTKSRLRGVRQSILTEDKLQKLLTIPGWSGRRWERNDGTGTVKVYGGWIASVMVSGIRYRGPLRSIQAQARDDYLVLREEVVNN